MLDGSRIRLTSMSIKRRNKAMNENEMTKLDELTKEVIEEVKEDQDFSTHIDTWLNDGRLIAENFANISSDSVVGLLFCMEPNAMRGFQMLMYIAYLTGVKQGRDEMLRELVGGELPSL